MRALLVGLSLTLTVFPLGSDDWSVVTHATPVAPQRMELALLDDDRLPDFVFSSHDVYPGVSWSDYAVWRNTGDGQFVPHWTTRLRTAGGTVIGPALAAADLDEDQHVDLVVTGVGGSGSFFVMFGDGTGSFSSPSPGAGYGGIMDDVSIVDYDGDGHLDVGTTTDDLGPYVDRFRGSGTGRFFINEIPFDFFGGWSPGELASGDLTGDGTPRDVVADKAGPHVFLEFGANDPPLLTDTPTASPVVADFNADGIDDIAAVAPLDDQLIVVLASGGGHFLPPRVVPTGQRPDVLVAADLDGDGDSDLAVCNANSHSVNLFENDGAGRFRAVARLMVGRGPTDIAAADLDLDGDIDLAVANRGSSSVSVLINPLH